MIENENRHFSDENIFYRRLNPENHYNWVEDRISSAAFANTTGTNSMSVDDETKTTIEECLSRCTNNNWGIASIIAKTCYELNQQIEPTQTEDNPAHCDVIGNKKRKSTRESFRKQATCLIKPQNQSSKKN